MTQKTILAAFTQGNGIYEVVFDFTVSGNATQYWVRLNKVRLHVDDYDSNPNDSRVSINYSVTVDGTSVFSDSKTHVEWWGRTWYGVGANAIKYFDRTESKKTVTIEFNAAAKGNDGYATHRFDVDPLADSLLAPTQKVTGLTVTRSGNSYTGKWKVPSDATNSKTRNRFTGLQVKWNLDMASVADIADYDTMAANATENSNGYGEWTGNFSPWKGRALTRDAFYPKTSQKVNRVQCAVRGYHRRANNAKLLYGPWAGSVNYAFNLPRKPTVAWAYDDETSTATVTVKTNEGKDSHERYDTMVKVSIRKQDGKEAVLQNWASTKSTEWKKAVDVSPYITNLTAGKYVTVKCWAYARGIKGDNPAKASAVYSERSIAYPTAGAITSITCDKKTSTGRIKVALKLGSWTTGVQLQRRAGEDGSWTDVEGALDDGDCKALYDSYGAVDPEPGAYTYYRLKSTRDNYSVYSAAKRADCIFTAKPKITCSATVGVVSVTPASNGTSASVVMGFSDSTTNTGTELSWSDHKNAWSSTDGPSTQDVTGADSSSKSSKYKKTKTFNIGGLTPGTTYYARIRRYRVHEGETYYGSYSAVASFQAESAQDDRCGIISVTPDRAGTGATVIVGYTEDNSNDGTELSWSKSSGAWSSSDAELTAEEFTRAGGASSTKWAKQVTLTISGKLEPGATYYIRARRYKGDTHSPYSEAQKFTTESAADDTCTILSVTPSTSGERATVVVGINEDNANTGTIIEWSTDSAAWFSNQQPESLDATWSRAACPDANWAYQQTSYLRGLTPGKTYYIRARRYLAAGGNTTYGKWSARQSFKTPKVTASNDKCGIVSAKLTPDGKGAEVVIGWTEDTANDGTEVSWSTDKKAWHSNEQPSTMQATWADKASQSADWAKSQTVSLRGLELGSTYYIRARRYNESGEDGTTYSPYATMVSITTPQTATGGDDVRCGLVSVEPGSDGKSAVAVVGWDGDHTGCELSWSDDPDAWFSNEQPESSTFEWSDGRSKSASWSHTSTFHIHGLEEGTTYYVKARSYYEGEARIWSDYTGDVSVTPYSAPSAVILAGPSAVARGDSIELYWTVESDVDQVEWHVHEEGKPHVSLAQGEGALSHASIPASRYEGRSTLSLYVEAGCGGGLTDSNVIDVGIADVPSCSCACAPILGAQPATFEVYTDDPHARLLATLRAKGTSWALPDGDADQLEGDVAWTGTVTPSWAEVDWSSTILHASLEAAVAEAQAALAEADPEDEDAYGNAVTALADAQAALSANSGTVQVATVALPTTLALADNGPYEMAVQAVEPVAGLSSPEATCRFTVAWAHQAPSPSDGISVEPDEAARSVTITLAEPEGWAEGDVYDVYRQTRTGHDLIARDLASDAQVVDPYAPYGANDLHYRIAARTPDGDVAFSDFDYAMDVRVLRFDWGGEFVELPYNVELSDSYSKDYESRSHADGSVNGYYDRSVTMTGSYSADIVKADQKTAAALRALAEHPGAAFCRTAQGMAFQANVDVSGLDASYASAASGVQLSISAMKLTLFTAKGVE